MPNVGQEILTLFETHDFTLFEELMISHIQYIYLSLALIRAPALIIAPTGYPQRFFGPGALLGHGALSGHYGTPKLANYLDLHLEFDDNGN